MRTNIAFKNGYYILLLLSYLITGCGRRPDRHDPELDKAKRLIQFVNEMPGVGYDMNSVDAD